MSHFSVAVVTNTGSEEEVERLLAPYQENNMGDCPEEYLEFIEDEDADIDDETGKTAAQLTLAQKNKRSHRAIALQNLLKKWPEWQNS